MAARSLKLHIVAFNLRTRIPGQQKCVEFCRPNVTLWRGFCSDSNIKNDKTSEKKAESALKETDVKKKEAMSKQLLQQILSMKVTGVYDSQASEPLNLARPTWGDKRQKIKEMEKIERETPREHPDLDTKIVSAVKDVASDLGGDTEKIESELLQKLRSHNAETEELRSSIKLGDLVAGLKIERTKMQTEARGLPGQTRGRFSEDALNGNERYKTSSHYDRSSSMRPMRTKSFALAERTDIDLFGSPPLNIFTRKSAANDAPQLDFPVLATWDALEEHELQLLVIQPFANAFEEHIQWTKEGKLWKFPINNEQGLDEEAKIGFHEHVFLEPLIEDFPKKGPIRHFMELVCVGLSKNFYLTVQQKKDHIDWFRSYFKDKEAILKEVGVLG